MRGRQIEAQGGLSGSLQDSPAWSPPKGPEGELVRDSPPRPFTIIIERQCSLGV